MKIIDIVRQRQTISFEFFPPKTKDGIPDVLQTIDNLKQFQPDFVSVTYGAGGTTQAFTEEITVQIKEKSDLEVMAHLTCSGQTENEVHQVLERLDQAGIENIIALRGDPPKGQSDFTAVDGGFSHASDLLRHIGKNFEFGLAAACYPEAHAESVDLESDMAHTKYKVDQGAQFLVTQLFYNNDDYFRFVDRARSAGIDVPLIPGVLPILSTPQIRRFTGMCGATIPKDLDAKLESFAHDDDAARELGVEYATKQVEELCANGAPGIHFYVLNRTYSVSNILNNLNLPGHTAAS